MHFLKLFYYIFKGYNYKCFYEQFTGKLKFLHLKTNYCIPLADEFSPSQQLVQATGQHLLFGENRVRPTQLALQTRLCAGEGTGLHLLGSQC